MRDQGRVTPNYLVLMVHGRHDRWCRPRFRPGAPDNRVCLGRGDRAGFRAAGQDPARPGAPALERGQSWADRDLRRMWGAHARCSTHILALATHGASTVEAFVHNPEVERIALPTLLDLLVSSAGAVAGVTMVAAYRRSVIAGPLIALALIRLGGRCWRCDLRRRP